MKKITENSIIDFSMDLSSKAPTPGGGGASALIGAISAALCSMVANLTTGKKKYTEYQSDIDDILECTSASITKLIELIDKDAECFLPLSRAYNIPKDDSKRNEILEKALIDACSIPMKILEEVYQIISIIEQLTVKGSRLALSDVGVAASACRCSIESAVMNVYINTNLMKNRDYAIEINTKAENIFNDGVNRCNIVYQHIYKELRK